MEATFEETAKFLENRAAEIVENAKAEAAELLRRAENLRGKSTPPVSARSLPPEPQLTPFQASASSRITSEPFKGMTTAVALESYMRARKGEGRIPLTNVVFDLVVVGGLDMGPHKDRYERFVIAAAQGKPRLYGWDPEKRELWLAPTADERPKVKAGGRSRLAIRKERVG